MQHRSFSKMLRLFLAAVPLAAATEVANLRARSSALRSTNRHLQEPFAAPGSRKVEGAPWEDIPVEPAAPEQTAAQDCGPKCQYQCEQPQCNSAQECDPVCDPPICETSCSSSAETCETRCGEPLCAVVCPETECVGVDCSSSLKCKTVCSPPVCTTACADNCKTTCAKPLCQWNCKANSKCPEPSCKMSCMQLDCPTAMSSVVGNETAREKARQKARRELEESLKKDGRVLVAQAYAHLQPGVLEEDPSAPLMPVVAPKREEEAPTTTELARMAEPVVVTSPPNEPKEQNAWLWGSLSAPADH
eukprot:gb/GFBE01060086.1/.p1 GENE.gb/GFBE01060086.1/~~gb/GFBE01060086.1/.p1  ORF type:complete len:304 (+),score=54.63 gb/GFBE01060086.1/:1-912(+)